ncbi:MAG: hypothetical protein JST00_00855 [Deltaproteobacteria bacterium]|nr:hypothetical protein [Deltaproteobacteria bacterium]
MPEHPGVACHGLQMFVNLADPHERAAPAAFHASRTEVPDVAPAPGVRVRVLAGSYGGVASPLTSLLTPLTFLEVHLAPGAGVEIVMTNAQDLRDARDRFARGEMGKL